MIPIPAVYADNAIGAQDERFTETQQQPVALGLIGTCLETCPSLELATSQLKYWRHQLADIPLP